MSVETAIYSRLSTHAGVKALVSTRIYPLVLPQTPTIPAISYQTVDKQYEALNAYSDDGCLSTTLQIDCWDYTYAGVKAVADQVVVALMNWSQSISPVIWRVFHTGEGDSYESDTLLYRVSIDFEVKSPST